MASGKVKTRMELLWENPNPSSSFARQKVPLDLTDYLFVCVEVNQGSSPVVPVGGGFEIHTNYPSTWRYRSYAVYNDGILFYDAGPNNGECVPQKIYGIR